MEKIEIPWEVVIFIALFALVLFYLIFFQQYLTALIFRLILRFFLPGLQFRRIAFSVVTGQISIHRVKFVTQDMSIEIGSVRGFLHYWNKISDYQNENEKPKPRFDLKLFGLRLTIYNRTWATDLAETVMKKFQEGQTTQEVCEYLKSLYPAPKPYQLSMLFRAILPLTFHIYAASITIGNPRLPSSLVFKLTSMNGIYKIIPKKSPETNYRSRIAMDINGVTFRSIPQPIDPKYTPKFANSMRKINERSKKILPILEAETMYVDIVQDMWGLYILTDGFQEALQVTQEPKMIINIKFLGPTTLEYGPYTDKLRSAFMTFFTPFNYNDSIFYDDCKNRIKYWDINLTFQDGCSISLPFVTNEERFEDVTIEAGENSTLQCVIPQYVASVAENKNEISANINNFILVTSIPNTPPVIQSDTLQLTVNMFYPEKWNSLTQMSIFAHFQNSKIIMHPYHIDFLAQLGTDWSSWNPYQVPDYTIFNFFPYSYYIQVVFEPAVIHLLSSDPCKYKFISNYEHFPRGEIHTVGLVFKLSAPMIFYEAEQKAITFSAELGQSRLYFVLPANHFTQMRRDIEGFYDYMTFDRMMCSGGYRWCADPTGECQIPLTIKISNVGGLITIFSLNTLIAIITNYASKPRLHPEEYKDTLPEYDFKYVNHANVIVMISKASINVPLDLYDPYNYFTASVTDFMIGMEGFYPNWHMVLDFGPIVVKLPQTEDYPYDVFYKMRCACENGVQEGELHVDGLSLKMTTISHWKKPLMTEVSAKTSLTVGTIGGYFLLPQVVSLIELAFNIIHQFFSEDSHQLQPINPQFIYLYRVIRVAVGSACVFVDMGNFGLLVANLPAGVLVYGDTLIDSNSHSAFFVHLPVVDAHLLLVDQESEEISCLLRTTTYLNVIRDVKYEDSRDDSARQAEILRSNDFFNEDIPFVWMNPNNIKEEFVYVPELLRPKTYISSLDEKYILTEKAVADPLNNGEYTAFVPIIQFETNEKFVTFEDGLQWLHHYESYRYFSHQFPNTQSRLAKHHDLIQPESNILGPTVSYQREQEKVYRPHTAIRLILPQPLIARVRPTAIIPLATILTMFDLRPNCQIMSSLAKKSSSKNFELGYVAHIEIMIVIPSAKIIMKSDDLNLNIVARDFRLCLIEDFENHKRDSSVSLLLSNASIDASRPDENPSVSLSVPNLRLASHAEQTVLKIDAINLNALEGTPLLIHSIISTILPMVEGFPLPTIGKRSQELHEIIRNHPNYPIWLQEITEAQYSFDNPTIHPDVLAQVTAEYMVLHQMKIDHYTKIWMFMADDVPAPKPSTTLSKTTIFIPPININLQHSKNEKSEVKIDPLPLVLESIENKTGISFGLNSFYVNISPKIFEYLKAIPENIGQNSIPKPPKPKDNKNIDKCLMLHLILNKIDIHFMQAMIHLEHISTALSITPAGEMFRSFSISGSMKNLLINVGEYIKIHLKGFAVCQRNDSKEGVLHVYPIKVYVSLAFILNPGKFFDLSFLEEIPMSKKKKKKSKKQSKKEKKKTMHKSESRKELVEKIISEGSTTLMIGKITLTAQLTQNTKAEIVIPRCSGLSHSHDQIMYYFVFLHNPRITIENVISFPLAHFLLNGSIDMPNNSFDVLLMIGEIVGKAQSKNLSDIANFLNELLSTFESLKPDNPSIKTNEVVKKPSSNKPKEKKERGLQISIKFEMPKFAMELPEIQSVVSLAALWFALELGDGLNWRAWVDEIVVAISDSSLSTSLEAISEGLKSTIDIQMPQLRIGLSQTFFSRIPTLIQFFAVITDGFKKQHHVQQMIKDINVHIQEKVEKTADQLMEKMGLDSEDQLEIPSIINFILFFCIHDIIFELSLLEDGEFIARIPEISLLIQSKSSKSHDKIANGMRFMILNPSIVLDTNEISHLTNSQEFFENSFKAGNDDQYRQEKYSMIYCREIAITAFSFQNKITFDSIVDGLTVELFPSVPAAVMQILSVLKTTNLDSKPKVQKESAKNDIQRSQSAPIEKKYKKPKKDLDITGLFRCLNTKLVLSPIQNVLPIPSIELNIVLLGKSLSASINLPRKVTIKLTPMLLRWITNIRHIIAIEEEIREMSEEEEKEKENVAEKEDEAIPKSRKEPFKINLIVNTAGVEVNCGCQPKRTDLACIFGFQQVVILHSSQSDSTNLVVKSIYLKTQGIYASENTYSRTSRLFEFNIPRTDVFIGPTEKEVVVESVNTSFSSDKIEEITLFNDVWIQPLIKTLTADVKKEHPEIKKIKYEAQQAIKTKAEVVKSSSRFTVTIKSINIFFNYVAGAGHLEIKLVPIHLQLADDLALVSINSATVQSAGQLTMNFNLKDFFILRYQQQMTTSTLVVFKGITFYIQSTEEPIFSFTLGKTGFFSRVVPANPRTQSVFFLSLDSPALKLTAITAPSLKSFIRTVSEPIIVGLARANQSDEDIEPKKVVQKIAKKLFVDSHLHVLTNGVKLELYRYNFTDNDAIQLVIKALWLQLDLIHDGKIRMKRKLIIKLQPINLSRLEKKGNQMRDILKLPAFKAELDTTQEAPEDPKIKYNFTTAFDGLIEPSLNLSDYEMLLTLIKFTGSNFVSKQAEPINKSKKDPQQKIIYQFQPVKYEFNPGFKVGIGTSINPDVAWLLKRLDISDEHIIPSSLFEFACLGLEKLLDKLNGVIIDDPDKQK